MHLPRVQSCTERYASAPPKPSRPRPAIESATLIARGPAARRAIATPVARRRHPGRAAERHAGDEQCRGAGGSTRSGAGGGEDRRPGGDRRRIRRRPRERGQEGPPWTGDLDVELGAAAHAKGAPERAHAEHDEHGRADDAEHDAERADGEQRHGARGAERRVDAVDHGDPGADRQAHRPAAPQRRADEEERHRPELDGDDEAQTEANEDGMHAQNPNRTARAEPGSGTRRSGAGRGGRPPRRRRGRPRARRGCGT